jgi:preprotein translocase SecE subunit
MEQADDARSGGVLGKVEAARGFLEGVQLELRKVAWPTRPELFKATRMVVIMAILLGVAIGLVDWFLNLILVRGVAALVQ